ncbi:hypothetical protein M2124_000291 [Polynucleobacter sphagniphilus]|uniref:hypothetical protein n=1 Tax=Polynucleobacter sphagniphilus TaxID=1743169 RepID=UPI002473B53F|nr:hypothetical protein [Polynucleobacter sphagniphilus]MDH6154035.1 hypothetical protein [Polynucleobacter sphagniphilus]
MFKNWIRKIDLARTLYLILFFEFINVGYYCYYLSNHGYLPAPFALDKNDTLMDFYNPLFWVIKNGFYTTFNSVYPAINYFFLKIFSLGISPDQISNPFQLRNDFPILGIFISFIYVLIIWVVVNIGEWRKVNFSHKGLIFLACLLSVPVLFGLERGNLIFLALLFLALYLNASNPWLKAICLGLLINVKPYFAILLVQYLNIHQFNKVELIRSILITAAIFFVSGFFAGINFIDFFKAYLSFSKNTTLSVEGVVALPHSIAALSTIKALISFGEGSRYTFWFSLLKVINYVAVLILLCTVLLKKTTLLELLIASIIILTNFSISTGGYILIIYIVLIPYLLQSKEYKKLLFFILLIYALPVDWINFKELSYPYIYSYLGGNIYINNPGFFFSIGSIIRPLFNFSLLIIFLMSLFRKYPRMIYVD